MLWLLNSRKREKMKLLYPMVQVGQVSVYSGGNPLLALGQVVHSYITSQWRLSCSPGAAIQPLILTELVVSSESFNLTH